MKTSKNILIVSVIIVLNLCSAAFAQNAPSFSSWHGDNTWKLSVLGGAFGTAKLSDIKAEAGAEIAYYHYGWEAAGRAMWADSGEKFNLQEASLHLRRYILPNAKVTPIIGIAAGVTRQATGLVKTGETEKKVKWGAGIVTRELCFNAQATFGIEWRVAPKFAIALEIGGGYNFKENVNAKETLALNIDLKEGQEVDLSSIKIKDADKFKLHGIAKLTYTLSGGKKVKSNSKKLTALANY